MREHWQPSSFERLGQGSQARALMVARARAAWLTAELPPSAPPIHRHPHRSLRIVSASLSVATSLALAACGPTPKSTPINPETKTPSTQTIQKTTPENFLPFKGLSRLTGGPHDSLRKGGIRDGIDVAPNVSVACSPGVRKVLDEPLVVASASGTVKKVGNENNRNDPDHSIVEIAKDDGSIVGATHLDQIRVSVGDKVTGGETVIGKVSCEVPPGGETEAMHVHVSVRGKNGEQIPIAGHTFSGYTAHAAAKESNGTMIRKDGQVITAIDGQRCGPDESSIKACGGKRNDLNTGAVLGESVKVTLLPTVAPAKPAQKSIEQPLPADPLTFSSLRFPYQFKAPQGWINGPYHQGGSTDVYFGVQQKPATALMITFTPARSDVKLEALKNQIIGPGDSRTEALPGNRGVMVIKFQEKYINGLDAWEKITFDLKMVTRDIVFVRPGET